MDDGTGTPIRPAAILATSAGLTASPGSSSPMQAIAPTAAFTPNGDATAADSVTNGVCVFSGGTAANSLVDAFQAVAKHLSRDDKGDTTRQRENKQPCSLTYIIPISDNGGSSSELIRFFGGPSVGDVRSRLVRLIPSSDDEGNERGALRALFEHRLCASDPNQARTEWLDLVEARHLLWTFVPSATRELIRAVLNTLNLEIVKRARPSTSVFNFAGASVGNLFLTGARLFSGSFEAGIFLLSLLCGIPDHVAVLPAINSNFTHHISAGLVDGTTIAGQVNISHPSLPTALPDGGPPTGNATGGGGGGGEMDCAGEVDVGPTDGRVPSGPGPVFRSGLKARKRASTAVDFEDATLPGSLPALRQPQITFSKEDEEDLPSRISRIWYINPYGHEIRPQANPKALAALRKAEAIIYSIGSLYTSIIPSLVLRGVGAAIAHNGSKEDSSEPPRKKVLILNSRLDRETGPRHQAMTAVDFVRAIVAACKQSQSDFSPVQDSECHRYVTHLVYLDSAPHMGGSSSSAAPEVDKEALGHLGIQCLAVPTQASQESQDARDGATVASKKAMGRYDQAALTQTLKNLLDGSWDR
ncbi:uncharacterized protein SPSK_08841 [Sporothrix schenckii 1099-18]|uniref:Uncharacterized protein n=1 Tax=Sporothrix schenckii 1099-18 TaxID=1397361 RepID=A0A0F2M700_SPOSC|nr:uncharacterized protein SPSK_08841 [Sporothrix schenckii 1099-18]KJR84590.1 hypothetical protein SPSK_08841 [Sporothrix schenckii 1099-18]